MPEDVYISDKGTIVKERFETEEVELTDYLDELANEKLSVLKGREQLQQQIEQLKARHTEREQSITAKYQKVVPELSAGFKQLLQEEHIELNNKLAEAFPSDFDKVTRTIVADEGGRADGKPIVKV